MAGSRFGVPLLAAVVFACVTWAAPLHSTPQASGQAETSSVPRIFTDPEMERFLLDARIVRTGATAKGVTGSLRATLTDGTLTHDAHIQTVDESKREFQSSRGVEFNFRDSWTFNVAAYKLDRMLGLQMVPVSVSRRWNSKPAAYTWWVDDVLMDEGDRLKKKVPPPQPRLWAEQMQMVRLFDQLIYNIDRNMGNLLIGKGWKVWAIDHTRAFRTHHDPKSLDSITRCDRQVFERLKALESETLKREMGPMLDTWQIRAILERRDRIVQRLESLGPTALFDRQS
jgi:hypothetical protein